MVLFSDIQILDNGARFLNVDLHIHSYGASHDVTDATMTPEAVVDSAVRQGLSVIAITDHKTMSTFSEQSIMRRAIMSARFSFFPESR